MLFFIALLNLYSLLFQPAVVADPCTVYGAVYFEKNSNNAQYRVYLEPESGLERLTVFKEENKLFADQPGLWFEVADPTFADYIIYLTPERGSADFTIHYTTTRSFAGCRR